MASLTRVAGLPKFASLKPRVHKGQESGPSVESESLGNLWRDLKSEQSLGSSQMLEWSTGGGQRDSEAGNRYKYEPWELEERGVTLALISGSLCYSPWISKEYLSMDVLWNGRIFSRIGVRREPSNSPLEINTVFIVVALICYPFLLKHKISDMNISCL